MIIVKTPLRLSFFGGGTDIPMIYNEIGGCVFSSTIAKHIYICLNRKWPEEDVSVTAKYTILESEIHPRYLKHPIMRTVLEKEQLSGVDISVSSDIQGGTGLGSSSAFTVGFLLATRALLREETTKYDLAKLACAIEIDELQEPIGKQDTYAATFGGLNRYDFHTNGEVRITPTKFDANSLDLLRRSLFLVRVGGVRKTSDLLVRQLTELSNKKDKLSTYQKMAEQAAWASSLVKLDLEQFGCAIDEAWRLKKSLSPNISNEEIDSLIKLGKSQGAIGAKLLGAGMSGFVLFIVPEESQEKFMIAMDSSKFIRPQLESKGAEVIYS